jgi:hypothetical protein
MFSPGKRFSNGNSDKAVNYIHAKDINATSNREMKNERDLPHIIVILLELELEPQNMAFWPLVLEWIYAHSLHP